MSWGAIASTAVAAVGSWYSGQQAKKRSRTDKELERLNLNITRDNASRGTKLLDSGMLAMDQFDDYWKKIGRGDRESALSMLAPQLAEGDAQDRAAFGSDLLLGGRRSSAGAGNYLALRDSASARRNNALLGLKGASIDALGSSAEWRSSLGSNLLTGSQASSMGLLRHRATDRNERYNRAREAAAAWGELGDRVGKGVDAWRSRPRTQRTPSNQYAPSTYIDPKWSGDE